MSNNNKVNRRGTEEERFWAKVRIAENGCWEWQGAISDGYGTFSLASPRFRVKGKMVKAHKWAYEYLIGPVPDGLELDHTCRNRRCVNPFHLEPVTSLVNITRGQNVCMLNAQKLFCKRGHPLTGENAGRVISKNGKPGRRCRACGIAAAKRNKQIRKAKSV